MAIARLNKIQKKKRCIFIMATVSKDQTYIYMWFWLSVVMRNTTERGFKNKKILILVVIHKRTVCSVIQ